MRVGHHTPRTVSFSVIRKRLQELVDANVDIDKLPSGMTVSELVRLPLSWFMERYDKKA